MAKKKLPPTTIKNREEADAALSEIARLGKAIAAHNAAIIAETAQVEAYELLIKNQEKALKAFATRDMKNWKGKSLALFNGILSFNTSPGKVGVIPAVAKKLDDALTLLAGFTWGQPFIRRTPTLDKEALIKAMDDKKLSPEQLALAGLKVEKQEVFSYKLAGE